MAKASATASFGAKLKTKGNPLLDQYENVSPHASIGVEIDLPTDTTGEAAVEESIKLYSLCRKFVETEIETDIRNSKGLPAK